jgi:hypothetical protein
MRAFAAKQIEAEAKAVNENAMADVIGDDMLHAVPASWVAMEARMLELETRLLNLESPPPSPVTKEETITATMVGGTFNCPECGLRITSPAMIKTQGLKSGGYYEHPFDEAPRLNGGKCRLIGRKFESPSVVLKMITPKPVAPKVDIQETIGV